MTSKESSKLDLKLSVIMMQSYPARTLDRRLQKDWARDAREDPRVLKSLRTHLLLEVASPLSLPSPFRCHSSSKEQRNPLMKKNLGLQALMELTSCGIRASSSSVNGEGSTPKDPLYKILDELRSLKLWKEKQERKEKRKKKKERKILKELRKEKHASSSSHNSCKSLSEELRDYYEGRHRSHLRPHSHGREMERKPQEANINLPYFNGKDNVEADLDWEIREVYFKILWLSLLSKENQGQGILGVTPSKPKDDKGKTIEKQPLKASMQEKTRFMKCFKCLGRGHITYQCPTKKNMIMRGQDIYSSQDEVTTSTSSSESEEAKGEESSEEIYPQGEGQPLMVKEECKEVSVSSKRLAKKESHFEVKTNIKETYPLRQPPHFLLCKKTLVSIATPLRLEFIPQVKELLDEGLVRKSLNPCALCCGKKPRVSRTSGFEGEGMMQSYPARALDRRIQKDWARDAREGPRVLMSLRVMKSYPARTLDRRLQEDWARDAREGPREECKEVSVSSKRLAKKERHFEIKTNIKEISPLRQPLHFLLCKKTLVSIASPLRLEFIPQVKKLLDEGLVRKSLNPCALLVPKIGVPMNPKRIKVIPEGPTPPSIREIWGFHDLTNFYKSVEEKSPEFQEPRDLRSNPFQGGGNDAILPHKGIGYKTPRRLGQRCKELHFKVQTSFEAQNFVLLLSFSLYASSPTFKLLSMASYGGELLLDSSSP
ncbi:hypothetical protein HKD37_18G050662 [Glycine soja]